MDEAVHDTLLQSWEVIGDLSTLPHMEGVVAVGEKDGLELALVVQKVALVDVVQLYLVLPP
jgi:hypothetical protein